MVAAGTLALVLAGCGVRGPLETPGATKDASGTKAAATKTAPGEPAPKPPHRDFILDGLIR